MRFVRAGVSGESDCGLERTQRKNPPQKTPQLHLRVEPLHVLRPVRGRLSYRRAGADPGFRAGQLYPRRGHLEPRDAGEGPATDAVQEIAVVSRRSSVVRKTS